jgi:mannose/fructose/N-acetylgalactosamine-specific phosphotransferase system component IIC
MELAPLALLALCLFGGWVAADATSFGQLMVSRPIVASSLAGWIAGDPLAGAMIGLVLEVLSIDVLPVGAVRYPESGPAAVVAGAAYATSSQTASAMLLIVAFSLGWEYIGGATVHQIRQLNVKLVAARIVTDPDSLQWRHPAATALDAGRGVVLVLAGWLLVAGLLPVLNPLWGLSERLTGLLLGGVVTGMIASSFGMLGGRGSWFALGVAAGVLVLLVTR